MLAILTHLNELRALSGNEQLDYLRQIQSPLLKEIMDYTYNPDKMYKIDTGKYGKILIQQGLIPRKKKEDFTEEDWIKFTKLLDTCTELRAVTEFDVRTIKYFITGFVNINVQMFLEMVLFKDLRLNLNIKKFQKVWPDFCNRPQLQLAEDYEGQLFENGLYSRKFDGKRMYIENGIAYSRAGKPCKVAPIQHILEQLNGDMIDTVFDGEVLYFEADGKEDFQKVVSLAGRDRRDKQCDNLYYVIFDAMNCCDFNSQNSTMDFKFIYDLLLNMFEAKPSERFGYSVLDTKYPNVLIARQDRSKDVLMQYKEKYDWEGLMYRNADASYQFKRSSNILKIKDMQDGEFEIVGMLEGTGKNAGRLGALLVKFKDSYVGVGSGFTDEDRQLIWDNKDIILSLPFKIAFSVKVQYFEETVDAHGKPSLRFPVFLCFRHDDSKEEHTVSQVIEFCKSRIKDVER